MNRRDLLKAAPAGMLAGGLPAAAAYAETPVAALFSDWRHQHRRIEESSSALSDDECDAMNSVLVSIEARLFAEPALDYRDICLKLLALTLDGTDFMDDAHRSGLKICREARAMVHA